MHTYICTHTHTYMYVDHEESDSDDEVGDLNAPLTQMPRPRHPAGESYTHILMYPYTHVLIFSYMDVLVLALATIPFTNDNDTTIEVSPKPIREQKLLQVACVCVCVCVCVCMYVADSFHTFVYSHDQPSDMQVTPEDNTTTDPVLRSESQSPILLLPPLEKATQRVCTSYQHSTNLHTHTHI